jgi:hypothetical protein
MLLFIKFGKHQASLWWEFKTLQEELATQVWVRLGSRPWGVWAPAVQYALIVCRVNPEMKYKLPGIRKVHFYYCNLLNTFTSLSYNPGIYFIVPSFSCLISYPSALIFLAEFDPYKQHKSEQNCIIRTSYKNSIPHGGDFEDHCLLWCAHRILEYTYRRFRRTLFFFLNLLYVP